MVRVRADAPSLIDGDYAVKILLLVVGPGLSVI
jgi:hypothetical protein